MEDETSLVFFIGFILYVFNIGTNITARTIIGIFGLGCFIINFIEKSQKEEEIR